ncbi:MAG TPA: hypothetical protein VF008_27655 [Niastella sp.]
MRKILLNVSSISYNLLPHQATPLTSQLTEFQRLTGRSLINPTCVIAIISSSFTS